MMAVSEDLFGLMITALIIDCTAVGIRSWIRIKLLRSFGYDDALLALSLFLLLSQIVYMLTSAAVKTGVALALIRINVKTPIRNILVVSMTMVLVVIFAHLLLFTLQCRPLSLHWDIGEGSCLEFSIIWKSSIVLSVVDIASNWLYALLPVVMLYKLQMNKRVKISAIIILGLGLLSSIATIVRFKYILSINDRDPTLVWIREMENCIQAIVWCHVEIFLAILASSLIALRPLIKRANDTLDQRQQNWSKANVFGSQVAMIKDHSGVTLSMA
ncbi:hypothetical protein F5Y04DRAFT_95444 [Hypomontagnella monticulosa]|nr:hypothetical protein F5Y04DRAFT_95444 [Hypomontagnella monticulosa]